MKNSSINTSQSNQFLLSELNSTRKLLREIQEMSSIGTWEIDLLTGKVIWSTMAYHILGEKTGSVKPSLNAFLSYVHPTDLKEVKKVIDSHTRIKKDFSFYCRILTRKKMIRHVYGKGLFEKNSKGKAFRLCGVIHDISNVKEIQNRICLSEMMGQEHERARLSRELHDGLGQMLVGINFRLNAVDHSLSKQHSDQAACIHEINKDVMNTIREVRSISHNLSPHLLQKYGLVESVKHIANSVNTPSLTFHGKLRVVPDEHLSIILYRSAQELTTNIIRHSGATHGKIVLHGNTKEIVLTVEDNGKGFNLKKNKAVGIGMQGLRNRLHLVNGTLKISKCPDGKGTHIEVHVPLK